MARVFRMYSTALFWRFFAKYFALILIPVILASLFTNLFVVRLIERDAEKINNIVMQHFSEQTDATFTALETDMVNMLTTSNVKSYLTNGETANMRQRFELLHSIMQQLNSIQSHNLVYSTFLYFAKQDLVLDSNTYTNKNEYFKEQYPVQASDLPVYLGNFTDKKTMVFTSPHHVDEKPPYTKDVVATHSNLSILMSYPFNSNSPEVYLVVNVKRDKFRELFGMQEKWVMDTALVDATGSVLVNNGSSDIHIDSFASMVRMEPENSLFVSSGQKALSYRKSHFNDAWYYVSAIDLQTLLKPARMIRMITIFFLSLFVVMGSVLSYYLSQKLYNPIHDIKTRLASHRIGDMSISQEGNEFDVIKRFSNILISKNKELSQMVSGMFPIVQEHFISKILFGEYRDSLSIEYYAKEMNFPYHAKKAATALCIEIQYYAKFVEQLSEASKSFLIAELKENIHKLAPEMIWVCQTRSNELACVIHHEDCTGADLQGFVDRVMQLLQQSIFKASLGIGATVETIEDLYLSYDQAVTLLKYKSLDAGAEICLEESAMRSERVALESCLSVHEVNRIFNMHKAGEFDHLLQACFDLLDTGRRAKANANQMKNLCADILNTWIRAVENERNDFNISFYSSLFASINRCVTWEEIRQCFCDIHALLFRAIEPADRKLQFAEVLAYIHDHYNEEFSIEQFAQQMNMSVGHFSRSFKEEVGEKYVEYIAKYRIAMAKQYLLETDMKIEDIAEHVGYWGRNSFIRNFRKYEGTTPAKFRTMYHT